MDVERCSRSDMEHVTFEGMRVLGTDSMLVKTRSFLPSDPQRCRRYSETDLSAVHLFRAFGIYFLWRRIRSIKCYMLGRRCGLRTGRVWKHAISRSVSRRKQKKKKQLYARPATGVVSSNTSAACLAKLAFLGFLLLKMASISSKLQPRVSTKMR